jgi:hypothetical protein
LSDAVYFAHGVASRTEPSEKWARTEDLLLDAGPEHDVRADDLDVVDARVVLPGAGRAGGDPLREHRVLARVGREADAALVGHRARGLEEEQAAARILEVDAPAQRVARHDRVVAVVVVPAERELEAALAGGRAVAGAAGAAEAGEDRLDWLRKLWSKGLSMSTTVTFAVDVRPPLRRVMVALPLPTGIAIAPSTHDRRDRSTCRRCRP